MPVVKVKINGVWVPTTLPAHSHNASAITKGTLASARLPVVPVEKGGTGAATAAEARDNLEAAPAYTYGTEDLTAGESALETGKLYFVYE